MSNLSGAPGGPSEPNSAQTSIKEQENGATNEPCSTTGGTTLMRDTELLRGVEPGAQVWTTYVQETKSHDNELVERWNRGLEVTLVFAALFSAIVTAFVLESVKSLRPDSSQVAMDALMEMSQVLRGIAAGQPLTPEQPNALDRSDFRPSVYSIWINSLFFLSLSLSIAASLVAMLAKQWCYNFLSGRTGDAIDQAETRQGMFNGIEKWNMGEALEMVPVLMHISLGFFWAGLVLYLWDINIVVAVVVTFLAGVTACFYFGTMLLSAVVKNCPFVTPQGEWVRRRIKRFSTAVLGPKAAGCNTFLTMLGRHLDRLASIFRRSADDPHNLGNGSNSVGLVANITRYFSTPTQLDGPPPEQSSYINAGTLGEHNNNVAKQRSTPHAMRPAFILESLSWLITHSRDSTTIGTAIGAWAIAELEIDREAISRKTSIQTVDLEQRIKSFLVSRFSACFKSSPELGVELKLLDDSTHLSLALDYSRWMTYFARSSLTGIKGELEALLKSKAFGQYPFIHLGLAFASLAESRFMSPHDAEKQMDKKALFTDRALVAMVDGITVASLNLTVSEDPEQRQKLASNLGIPHLVRILSEIPADVVNPSELQLRLSVMLSLAVFALRARFAYPFDPRRNGLAVEANQLVDDYHSGKLSPGCEGYAPFVVFSLVGLIHPKSKLNLDEETTRTICKLIQETRFFCSPSYDPTKSIIIHGITNHDSFQHHITQMLIEAMIPTFETRDSPLYIVRENIAFPALLLQKAAMGDWTESAPSTIEAGFQSTNGSRVFPSLLEAICKLVQDHFEGVVKLHPGVLVAATELLLREVKGLEKIDFKILMKTKGFLMAAPSPLRKTEPIGHVELASSTLALIMAESTDPRCFKAAIRALIYHLKRQSVGTVIEITAWFADKFCTPYLVPQENNLGKAPKRLETEQKRLLVLSGYSRLLASMIRNSSKPRKLLVRLQHLASDLSEGENWKLKLSHIREVFDRLVETKVDIQVTAFAVTGLAAWELRMPSMSPTAKALGGLEHSKSDLPSMSWGILMKHSLDQNRLPPEATEALLDTTVWLAAVSPKVPKLTPAHAHIILELISHIRSKPDARLRWALSVAATFWGLSLDEPGWKFWTAKDRKVYWEQYRHLSARRKDTTALLLIGLSRILFHYSTLQLNHESVKTIAHEIHNHMSTHSGGSSGLALGFLSPGLKFDVRRHVRESVWQYLEETEIYRPFSGSTNDVRELLRTAVAYDGGEGYAYEDPQPFIRSTTLEEQDEDASA